MNFGDRATYYELLEVNRKASTREIHEAYLRIKAAYSNDSLAMYSLVSPEERDQILRDLEQAYKVLSDELQRSRYDLALETEAPAGLGTGDPFGGSVVSIDRVPPMDFAASEEMLIPPALESRSEPEPAPQSFFSALRESPFSAATSPTVPTAPQRTPPPVAIAATRDRAAEPPPDQELKHLIAQEIEWRGALLKKIREIRGFSVEDMCAVTRLSKTYLNAIETEDFKKLPAPVFVRGFVVQICKALKLPHERAAAAYMARCYQARNDA